MLTRLLLHFFFLISATTLLAQPVNNAVKDVTMAAPNAASLGKYGDIPVSYFTGVPNIGIPIFTIEEGPLSLPITLNYHGAGIKVGETAGWVGLGWSLSAGGVISRTTMGIPDDVSEGYMNKGNLLLNPFSGGATLEREQVASGIRDAEPDIFNFSVGGYSGKFVVDKDNVIHQMPKSDLKISYVRKTSGANRTILRFVIIAPDGTRYIFGILENEAETSVSGIESTTYDNISVDAIAPTSWYLRKIESPDQYYSITLDYVSEKYAYKNLGSCSVTWNYNGGAYSGTSVHCGPTPYGTNTSVVNHYVTGRRLSQITNSSNTQKIVFVAGSANRQDLDTYQTENAKYLDRIEMYTPVNTTCPQKFQFTYDYMTSSGGTASEYKRLRLLSVQETHCNGSKPPYSLTYNTGTLPHRMYKGIDHWGYFNGVTTNEGKLNIPSISVDWLGQIRTPNFATANRESSEASMLIGTLKRITYPTGGYNEFTFEANEVKKATTTITNNYSYSLSNCTYPSGSCCTTTQPSSTKTFTSTELNQAKFSLKLYNLNISPYQYCNIGNPNPPAPSVQVIVKQTGQTAGLGSYSFNLLNTQSTGEVIKPLTDLANLQAGVSYTFTLYVFNGKADFQIFNESSTVTYVPRDVGGLRIKQIKAHDAFSSARDVIKNYKYTESDASTFSSAILYDEPKYYGYQHNYPGPDVGLIFNATSITPMGNFNGYHVGYTRVVEETNGNGRTEFFFATELSPTAFSDTYPYSPPQLTVRDGNLSLKRTYKQSGSTFTQIGEDTELAYGDSYTYLPGWIYKAYKHPAPDQVYPNQFAVYFETYQVRSSPYRLLKQEHTLDGVKTITTYEYDTGNNHLAPTAVVMTNSDGTVHRTESSYVFSLPTGNLRTALINKNMIGAPIETIQKVGSTTVDGSKLEYSFFNASTGVAQTGSSSALPIPYPHKFSRYEMTWNGTTVAPGAGWVLSGTIDSYYTSSSPGKGMPKQFTKVGWTPETYEWLNGKISKRTFASYIWMYNYQSGTKLLSSIVDIDGQTTSFLYDEFLRLKKTSARGGNVVTDYVYQYKDATHTYNSVYTKTTFPVVTNSALTQRETYQYLDGLGRALQTVEKKYSPAQKDVVKAVEYDNQGRPYKTFEPFETTGQTGAYTAPGGSYVHTLSQYEASPLSRVLSVKPPGWPYATTYAYGANSSNEIPTTPGGSTYYAANSLVKNTVTDPKGNRTINYVDKKGRLIATKQADSGSNAVLTYQVYDNKDRVTKVVPPGSTASSSTLNFEYTYDGADNILTKKVPDQAWMSYKYNGRDQLTFLQDANLLAAGQWINTQFDSYGRVTKTGTYSGTPANGDVVPASLAVVLSENIYGTAGIEIGKMKTAKTKILGTTSDLSVTYTYDTYGRVASSSGNNHLYLTAGSETHTLTYDFADHLLTDTRVHKPSSTQTYNLAERWTYDHAGRPVDYFHKLNGVENQISNLKHDWKDRITERNLGKVTTPLSTWLQSVDYTYNDQNWLLKINNNNLTGTNLAFPTVCTPALPNPGAYTIQADPDANDLFYLELCYNAPFTTTNGAIGGMPNNVTEKSGNIAQMAWKVKGRDRQSYNFSYDYLDRVLSATYYDVNSSNTATATNRFNETLNYDVRGNITSLTRTGFYQNGGSCGFNTIDQLTYSYTANTNKLKTVADAAPTTNNQRSFGFNPGAGGVGYGYDANGNLISDTYKGITNITYNHLNLPVSIQWGTAKKIDIVYDAAGGQLSRTVYTGAAVDYKQDYVAGVEYRTVGGTRKLESIAHAEGRRYNVNVNTGTSTESLRIEYSLRDHLGNTRLTFADKNSDGKIDVTNTATNEILSEQHYYPFGLSYGGNLWMNDGADVDNRYLYNGKELTSDHGLGWYNYGARWYDASIGRWNAIDPLAEKYQYWSPYNYTMNNPVLLIDPDGMQVIFNPQNEDGKDIDWEDLINELQQLTGLNLKIGKKGVLEYTTPKGKLGGSKSARKMLIKAIKHDDKITIMNDRYDESRTFMTGKTKEERNTVNLNFAQIESFSIGTSSDLNILTYGLGINFLHELGHTEAMGAMLDVNPAENDNAASNVDNVNKIRREMSEATGTDFGQRVNYYSGGLASDPGWQYQRFSQHADQRLDKKQKPTYGYIRHIPWNVIKQQLLKYK